MKTLSTVASSAMRTNTAPWACAKYQLWGVSSRLVSSSSPRASGCSTMARARSAADQAVALDPESPDAHLAMSYVHQAAFDLRAARASAQLAAGQAPGDPLLAARLAELELSLGDTAAALVEAEKAVAEALRGSVWTAQELRACGQAALTPSGRRDAVLSRSLTTRGLTRLIRLEADLAQADLQQAICADDQSPLARLGLGLALTRQGELDTGVRQFERNGVSFADGRAEEVASVILATGYRPAVACAS